MNNVQELRQILNALRSVTQPGGFVSPVYADMTLAEAKAEVERLSAAVESEHQRFVPMQRLAIPGVDCG